MIEPAPAPLDLRLVPSAVAAWTTTAAGVVLGWRVAFGLAVALLLVAACCVVGVRVRSLAPRSAGVVLAACLVGAGFAVAAGLRVHALVGHPLHDPKSGTFVTAVVELSDDPRLVTGPGPSRVVVAADLRMVTRGRDSAAVGGAVVVIAPAREWSTLLPGQEVVFRAAVDAPYRRDLTVATLRAAAAPIRAGPPSVLQRIAGDVRSTFADVAETALPGDAGTLLPALVVGDTSRIPQDTRADFRSAGLTHLLAVSGANVAIVLGAVLLLARAMSLGPLASVMLAAIALALFVVLARPSPSVLRAAVMGAIGLLGMVASRRKQAVPALATAILLLLMVFPALAVDAGFALSVVATAGLIAIAPTWADRLRGHGWPRAPAEAVAVATTAFVVTAPVVAALNGTVSVVSVVANIAVCCVIAPITVLGACAAVVGPLWHGGAEFVARLCDPLLRWLLFVAEESAAVPYTTIPVWSGFGGAAIVFVAIVLSVGAGWAYACRTPVGGAMARSRREPVDSSRSGASRARRRGTSRRTRGGRGDRRSPEPRRRRQ